MMGEMARWALPLSTLSVTTRLLQAQLGPSNKGPDDQDIHSVSPDLYHPPLTP